MHPIELEKQETRRIKRDFDIEPTKEQDLERLENRRFIKQQLGE